MDRYKRNIIVKEIGEDGQKKLLQSKVLVCGAGGIGSSVLINLTALGIGTIGIVDFDSLEITNLNRQYIHKEKNIGKLKVLSAKETILELNSGITVNTYPIKLEEDNGLEIIKQYDIVIDCFDTHKSTFLLNELCMKANKPLITGGSMGFIADVFVVIPHKTHCLECYFDKEKLVNDNEKKPAGVIAPTTSVSGAIKAFETVKLILGIGKNITDAPLFFDGKSSKSKRPSITDKNEICRCCGMHKAIF